MKKFLAGLLFALLVVPVFADDATPTTAPAAADQTAAAPDVAAPAAPKAKKAKGDEAGIKQLFSDVSDAWAAGDAKTIASHFVREGSIINPFGQEGWGREDVETVIAADLDTMKGSTQTFDGFKTYFVLPGFALVDVTGTVSGLKSSDGTAAPDASFHVYATVANRGGKWYFLSLRPYAFVKPGGTTDASAAPTAASTTPTADASATPAAK